MTVCIDIAIVKSACRSRW